MRVATDGGFCDTVRMKSISFDEVILLKKAVQARFGVNVHFHDYCSSQAFSLDEPNEALRAFIEAYFADRALRAAFNDGGTDFVLEAATGAEA